MLTQRQKDLVDYISSYQQEHGGVSPNFAEMAEGIGLVSRGRIHALLRSIEERGAIRRMKHHSRAIEVLRSNRYKAFRFDPEDKTLKPLETQIDLEDCIAEAEGK